MRASGDKARLRLGGSGSLKSGIIPYVFEIFPPILSRILGSAKAGDGKIKWSGRPLVVTEHID